MNTRRIKTSLMAFGLVLTSAGCQLHNKDHNQIASAKFEQRAIKKEHSQIQSKLRNYMRTKNINGSIAVVKDGKILFNAGEGFADFKKQTMNNASTTYPIGSITKSIVAVCVIQLQEKGKLNIQDSVSKYIPDFPNGQQIKLIHLLNHTSGVNTPLILKRDAKPSEIMEKLVQNDVKFPAGAKWDYNDINYIILGYIAEKVAGIPLHEYIQENIFNKAMMRHSGFMTQKNRMPYQAVGYVKADSKLILAKSLNMALLFGCGDIYSTALDLCLYDHALMSGKLISKPSVQAILTPGSKSSYGLGVYNKESYFYSRGVLSGWESLHAYYKDKTAVAILLNVRDKKTDIRQIAADIHKLAAADS